MPKLITDYLKRSCSAPLSTEEPSSLSNVETSSSSQRTEFDVQTSRAMLINEENSTNENKEIIPVQCQPGPHYSFPLKQLGKKKCSCQAYCFKNFSWVHNSEENDSVFCIFCKKYKGKLTAEHNMEEAYITKGFNIWKKALKAFVDHQQSNAHRAAITYESVVAKCSDGLEMTVNDLNKKRLAERKYFIKIMECIGFPACQGLVFRGNDGNDNPTLFRLLNKNNPAPLTRLDKESHLESSQHKYMHTDIQNELIELMAKQVLAKKIESRRLSKFFGVMADEYTDISNKELLSMCFRWIEDLRVHEDFV